MIATRGIAPAACRGARLFCLATNSTFSPSRALPGRIYASDDGRDETVGRLESMTGSSQAETSVVENGQPQAAGKPVASQKEVNKFASTFAPRASGSTGKPNPAYKGSWLYTVFDVQAWAALVVGGLLSFNVIFPSDEPDIARLMGMWSIWMFTIPSLRARECTQREKDALNLLFLLVPLCVSLCRCVAVLIGCPLTRPSPHSLSQGKRAAAVRLEELWVHLHVRHCIALRRVPVERVLDPGGG